MRNRFLGGLYTDGVVVAVAVVAVAAAAEGIRQWNVTVKDHILWPALSRHAGCARVAVRGLWTSTFAGRSPLL